MRCAASRHFRTQLGPQPSAAARAIWHPPQAPRSLVARGTPACTSATTCGSGGSREAHGSPPPCIALVTLKRQSCSAGSSASCAQLARFHIRSSRPSTRSTCRIGSPLLGTFRTLAQASVVLFVCFGCVGAASGSVGGVARGASLRRGRSDSGTFPFESCCDAGGGARSGAVTCGRGRPGRGLRRASDRVRCVRARRRNGHLQRHFIRPP
jgi:hypothetical protein